MATIIEAIDTQRSSRNLQRVHFAERTAFEAGYRVSSCGNIIISPRGAPKLHPNCDGYLLFTVTLPAGGRYPIKAHRLQAYQLFGERLYSPGTVVRHLDGNPRNNAAANIAIGTHSDNMMDRPAEVRSRIAGQANLKHDHKAVREFYASTGSYKLTKAQFGISSGGTLHAILNPGSRKAKAMQDGGLIPDTISAALNVNQTPTHA